MKKNLSLGLGIAAFLMSASAFATPQSCVPDATSWNDDTGGSLAIHCSNTNTWFFAKKALSGCTAVSVDTLKAWLSMAQAAILAGKTLTIDFTSCGGTATEFTWLQLNKS